jgi:4-oxalocrotonate tautomerase
MPIIRVEMYEGRTLEQKRELAEVLTRESCRILKCGPEQVHIIIENISRENWALGGKLASDG